MSKTWMAIHTIFTAAAVAVATFLMTQCGCGAAAKQTVIKDVGDVTSCIAPAIGALETCKAAKGTTAQCAVAAVVELIACVTTAQQQPAIVPAAKETSMIDKSQIQSVQWGLDMPKEVSGSLGKFVGPVAMYLHGGGLIHALAFECTAWVTAGGMPALWALFYDRDEHKIAALPLATSDVQLRPAPARPTDTGHNPACSCVDCTQKRLSGQAVNVAVPAPLPTGPTVACDVVGCSLPGGHTLPHSSSSQLELLATGGAYAAGGLPSAEFPTSSAPVTAQGVRDAMSLMALRIETLERQREINNSRHDVHEQGIAVLDNVNAAHATELTEISRRITALERMAHAPVTG